jgi:hypothetical protein
LVSGYEVHNIVRDEIMNRPGIALGIVPEPGDIQLINNTFHLHSRAAHQDFPEPGRKRHYLRIWLGWKLRLEMHALPADRPRDFLLFFSGMLA